MPKFKSDGPGVPKFLPIQLRVDVLQRLLIDHKVCAEELYCDTSRSKRILMNLLLQAAQKVKP